MFKPVVTIALVSSIAFSSCGGEKKEENKKEDNKQEETSRTTDDKKVNANMLADISITGMVSEIKCVSSVKKILSAMVGVTEIEINFSPAESVNHAMVKFDNNKVNDKEIVSAIEKLNDGAYKVEGVDIRKIEEKSNSSRKKSDEKEVTFTPTPSSSGSSGFALPNILDVFNIL